MDAADRAEWRARLGRTHWWLCSTCKTAFASQVQFEHWPHGGELIRHSECGHVLWWRSGIRQLTQYVEPWRPPPAVIPDVHPPRAQTRRQPRRKPAA